MALDKKTLPVPSWKGLYLDGVTVPGGMSKAENIFILPDGSAQRRNYERTLAESNVTVAGHGLKNVYELRKSDGSRYIFADLDNAGTSIASFGAELVTGASAFSGWTDVADWSYGSTKWTHAGTGTTTLTGKPTVTAAATYRIVVDVTCPLPSTAAGGWTYAKTDSTFTWTSSSGQSHIIWDQSWTHAASGGTTALNALRDFTPVIGQSYRIRVNATLGATNAGTCAVYCGGVLAGTISGANTTAYFEFVARFVTDTTGLRFVPTTDFAGSINKAYPYVPSKLDELTSVKKLINPNGATNAANLGDELLDNWSYNWYPELASQVSQSLTVKIGAATAGVITESGVYTYTTTATDTTAIQFIPTTAWGGSVNSCSIQAVTYAASTTEMKVIGGLVTGTTDYEVSWSNILTNLTAGNTIQPSWATMQDRAFRVDGTNLNYWFKDASGYHLLGVGAPVEPPTVASTTGGELTAGSYNVYYTYVKKDGLYVAEGNPSPVAFVEVAGTAITVSVVTLTDPDVTHIRIYRTLYNEPGGEAYLDSEISNETQTVTLIQPDDVIRDLNSTLEFDHDVPPLAKFVLTAGSRLWFVNLPNEVGGKSTIKWSLLDFPEDVPALNYQTFDPNDGDELVGACPLSSNLLVFKRRRTWLCDIFSAQVVDGVAALSKHIISPNLGCIASGSIQAVGLDSAMWLSSEGIILYSGGELKNVSKDRINSVIFDFINHGAEPFIDSVYLPLRRLYHINFLYRNSGDNTITSQRHFVYSIDSDAWTEYVYTSSTGTRHYELNFCLATDSNQRDVILVPYMVTTTGEITYVYQSDYESGDTFHSGYELLMDTTGDGTTALTSPYYAIADSQNNVYVTHLSATTPYDVFKIAEDGTKSKIVATADVITLAGIANLDQEPLVCCVKNDPDNNCFYFMARGVDAVYGNSYFIVKSTYDGTLSLITKQAYNLRYDMWNSFWMGLNSAGTILYYWQLDSRIYDTPSVSFVTGVLHKVVDLDSTPVDSAIYAEPKFFSTGPNSNSEAMDIFGENLYFYTEEYTGVGETYPIRRWINIFSLSSEEITESIPVTLAAQADRMAGLPGIMAISETEIYANSGTDIFKFSYENGAWVESLALEMNVMSTGGTPIVAKKSSGFLVLDQINETDPINQITVYAPGFVFESKVNIPADIGITKGICNLFGGTTDDTDYYEQIVIACDQDNSNVWKFYPDGYWEVVIDTETEDPDMNGVVVKIISNYVDLDISNDKRCSRAYLDTESEFATIGVFSLEPDYNVNRYVHSNGELTEPAGSVSRQVFGHPGRQTWDIDYSFDGTVEAWNTSRVDVSAKAQSFRYSIKVGDVVGANHGVLRIRPPKLDCQIRGKLNG